jgi:hypothetical protein
MSQDVYARIEEASRSGVAAVYLRQPCDAAGLESFNHRLQGKLGEATAEWYLSLLRLTNGLQINNSFFESADDFIEINLEHRAMDAIFNRYLIFGHSGNIDLYVYDKKRTERQFCVVGFYSVQDIYEEYFNIEELLAKLLNAELV